MTHDLITKIGKIVAKKENINEDEIRSLMLLVRKVLETMTEQERSHYLLLNLFCNWSAHTKITKSNTGLRILAKVNDALVDIRHSGDSMQIGLKMSEALGFAGLRAELKMFFGGISVQDDLISNNDIWGMSFLINLIEIIRDVPLCFPIKLDSNKQKIYDQIAQNPIKPGAGVVAIKLSNVEYPELNGKKLSNHLCLLIRTADTTTIVIPLVIDVRLK